jgi:signal transduction histidine kinase
MSEERLTIVWLTLTILIIITWYLFGEAIKTTEQAILFIVYCILLVIITFLLLRSKSQKAKIAEKEFLQKIIDNREAEKKKIASELHDSIQQNLYSINFDCYRIAKEYPALKWKIDEIIERINQTVNDIRAISSDLYPHQLEKLGLKKSLEALANELTYSSNIFFETNISDNIDDLFSNEIILNIYRIIQELLNNVMKHSNADKAKIEIYVKRPLVFITVEDNGKGFNINFKKIDSYREGFGLSNIHKRLKLIDGILNIGSEKSKGTKFKISIPIKKYL